MRIHILFQPVEGGTNVLLNKAARWLKDSEYEVIDARNGDSPIAVDLVLLPTSEMHRLPMLKHEGIECSRILVWVMGCRAFHGAFYNQMNRSRLFAVAMLPWHALSCSLMRSLLLHRAVVFTDEVGMNSDLPAGMTKVNNTDLIHPIAIRPPSLGRVAPPRHASRYAWLGRIDHDFKVRPLLRVIRDLSQHCTKTGSKAELLIIGSGNAESLIHKEVSRHPQVLVNWLPRVPNDELETVLAQGTDILFAMGTSALEGARVGLPTVLVQPFGAMESEPHCPYRWIGTTKGHSLGEFAWAEYPPLQVKLSFEELWDLPLDMRSEESQRYSGKFNLEHVLPALFHRPPPSAMSVRLWTLLKLHSKQHAFKRAVRSGLLSLQRKFA